LSKGFKSKSEFRVKYGYALNKERRTKVKSKFGPLYMATDNKRERKETDKCNSEIGLL